MSHDIYNAEELITYTIERIVMYNEKFDTKKTLELLRQLNFTTDDLHDDCHENCVSVDEYDCIEIENQELKENLEAALNRLDRFKEKYQKAFDWLENSF